MTTSTAPGSAPSTSEPTSAPGRFVEPHTKSAVSNAEAA